MSNGYRDDRPALLALAVIISGTVLAAFFGFLEQAQRSANYQPEEPRSAYEEEYNPWQDPWSQWTMAVFAVVAAGATRKIALDTRRTAALIYGIAVRWMNDGRSPAVTPDEECEEVIRGKLMLMVFSRFDYEDVFHPGVKRHTESCNIAYIQRVFGQKLTVGLAPAGPQNSAK